MRIAIACVLLACACSGEDGVTISEDNLAKDLPSCSAGSFGTVACHRLSVKLEEPIGSFSDENGAPGVAEPAIWYVSACTPELCVLFRVAKNNTRPFRFVGRKDLLAHTAPKHLGHTNLEAVRSRDARVMPVGEASYPDVTAFAWTQLQDIPDQGPEALVPRSGGCPDGVVSCGSNQDMSGRGTVLWSVDKPADGTFKGYVAFPSKNDDVVLASDQREQVTWVNRDNVAAGTATFRMVWQHVGNYWVWVSMLERVDSSDGQRHYETLRFQ